MDDIIDVLNLITMFMFKKIEIWVLYLTILLAILFALGFGTLVRQETEGITKKGSLDISFLSKPAAYIARLPEQFLISVLIDTMRLDQWLEFRDFYNQTGFSGTPNIEESYLLLSRYDGDLKEGVVELIDLTNFKILHSWNPDIDAFNDSIDQVDEFKYLNRDSNNARFIMYHPVISNKGDLIFHSQGTPLIKIDNCSNLIFQNTHDLFHHSIEMDIDANIWSSTHTYPQSLPKKQVGRQIPAEGGYLDDSIIKLSPDGEVIYEKSLSQIFMDNGMESRLSMIGTDHEFQIDPLHINDVQPVNFDGEYWKKGDVFISIGHQSMIILYRPSTEEILWKYEKNIFHQHDINILNEKEISIFNNNRKYLYQDIDIVDGHNEVMVYNFETDQMSSYLKKSLTETDVRTISQGRSDILSNGDLFIEDTDYARTLYFNSDGSLRWTHVNRATNGGIFRVGWSRIMHTKKDIQTINSFLNNKGECDE